MQGNTNNVRLNSEKKLFAFILPRYHLMTQFIVYNVSDYVYKYAGNVTATLGEVWGHLKGKMNT